MGDLFRFTEQFVVSLSGSMWGQKKNRHNSGAVFCTIGLSSLSFCRYLIPVVFLTDLFVPLTVLPDLAIPPLSLYLPPRARALLLYTSTLPSSLTLPVLQPRTWLGHASPEAWRVLEICFPGPAVFVPGWDRDGSSFRSGSDLEDSRRSYGSSLPLGPHELLNRIS
ncbi:hypothetical protein NDU88_008673 [Pleurodeles waltl]|uniref:Uncharacterized protein n=1 Tax=Pleurodeles waltl TaxID=8319 RepID=A0AAV7N7V8_PLEWA|nr:hypothetical protein NDU88_008673 [Pleurodeles waltl]